MAEASANKFKKAIQRLRTGDSSQSLSIIPQDNDLLRIEKRASGSEHLTDFAFLIRIDRSSGREFWWPIEYRASSGEFISCEKVINGKTMVNLSKQNQLVELAETWAKTLEAQQVAKTVENALR